MKQSRTKIAKVIADKTLSGDSVKNLSQEIAAYMLSERRVADVSSLVRDIQGMWAEAGYVEVLATSAHELDDQIKSLITDKVKSIYPRADRIVITQVHDANVIGGVRLNLADRQLDLSLRAKLNKFKQLTTSERTK